MDSDGHENRDKDDDVGDSSHSEKEKEYRSGTPPPFDDSKDHIIALLEAQNRRLEELLFQSISSASHSGNSTPNLKLPEFDPKHEGVDPKSWCATVECCINESNNRGGALVIALGRCLKGEAATWFTSIAGPDLTWDAFKSAFLTQWDSIDNPACVFFSFLRSQPKDGNETYITFASRMIHKLTASWKNLNHEQIAVAAVLGQLALTDSRVRRLAYTEDISSRDQLLKEMRVLNYKRPNDSNNETHVTPKKPRIASSHTPQRSGSFSEGQSRGSLPHPRSSSRASQRPTFSKSYDVTCYSCSAKGHIASRCPKKEETRQRELGNSSSQAVVKPTEKRVGLCQLNPTGTLIHKGTL
ncbi:hypothetical protein GE061_011779 [Apolygus lucorum]|uniref:CCHC-type domain-containing protein n=1 Tax=Apolygus lucorum TaxID=248454 RepID=A0A8S9XZV6_APOLU|nr:hypothetical protein GE061_011779 [Apolygus lucorum]